MTMKKVTTNPMADALREKPTYDLERWAKANKKVRAQRVREELKHGQLTKISNGQG